MKGHPRWFRRFTLVVAGSLLLSGMLLVPSMLMLRLGLDAPWPFEGPARTSVAIWHALSAMAGTWLTGALWTVHMRSGWHRHLQRASGALLAGLLAALLGSALGIWYLGDESWSMLAAWAHLVLGLLVCAPFAWHVWWAPRRRHPAMNRGGGRGQT